MPRIKSIYLNDIIITGTLELFCTVGIVITSKHCHAWIAGDITRRLNSQTLMLLKLTCTEQFGCI